jgi:CRISPR-associated protein Csm4
MAERVCYRLAARSPFHFGERGVGIEESSVLLHSDTLFSALCLSLRELGEDPEALLKRFPRTAPQASEPPPFRLSSAFPYAGEVCFFPRPMLKPQGLEEIADPTVGKTLKKIQFVSQVLFEALVAGSPVDSYLLGSDGKVRRDVLLQGGQVWVTPGELEKLRPFEEKETATIRLWEEQTTYRVTVDRGTNRSQVYQAGRVRFASGCGLFFLVDYEDTGWKGCLEKAMRVLGDAGVGGERSSGHGQFDLEVSPSFHLAEPEGANGYATLSLYWPTEPEVQSDVLEGASYGLVNRRGWLGSPDGMNLRRREVRMLVEGSVLRHRPEGALADVKPLDPAPVRNVPHDVWRYGLAFPVRCRVSDEQGGSR